MDPKTKTKYDNQTIQQIEAGIREYNAMAHQARQMVVDALVYLKSTGRYKENALYRNSSFKTYLAGEFNMREDTLIELNKAYAEQPKECERYGVGLVSKIQKQCGPIRGRKAWEEIHTTAEKRKKPITRTKIDEIVKKHARPKKAEDVVEVKISWRERYLAERKKNDRLAEEYRLAMEELAEAKERIKKLKAALIRLKEKQMEPEYA